MKILFLPRFSRKGASSRLRTFQYLPLFEKKGDQVVVKSFFDDQYLINLYSKKGNSKLKIATFFFKRLITLLSVKKYDLVIIEKELFPYAPALAERVLHLFKIKYVVDYDDAVFHYYDKSTNPIIKTFYPDKIDIVMKYSSLVVSGNNYLAKRAYTAQAQNIFQLPTVIDGNRYIQKKYTKQKEITIGWMGAPFSTKYLHFLKPVLKRLAQEFPIKLNIVGGYSIDLKNIEHIIPWSEKTEVEQIQKFDIGIMPLEDTPWEQGKCAYKLIQYMACGVPVIASPIGMNKKVIEHNKNGFLATTEDEWFDCLKALILSYPTRLAFGKKNYSIAHTNYTLNSIFNNYYKQLKAL